MNERKKFNWPGWLVFGTALLVWELGARGTPQLQLYFPPISQILAALAQAILSGSMAQHCAVTVGRFLQGYLLAAALAVPAQAQTKAEPPVPVRTVAPEYPDELRREGLSGLVMVKCSIDEQGNVTETVVEKSSNPAFEKPAVAALKKWKFKPARQDDKPVAIKVSIPIKFVFES